MSDDAFKANRKGVEQEDDVKRRLSFAVLDGRRVIGATVAAASALAIVYLALETPLYQAQSAIMIDTFTSRAMQNKGQGSSGADSGAETIDNNLVDSEVEVITSEGFARMVVRSLGLQRDQEFVGPPDRLIPKLLSWIQNSVAGVKSLFSSNSGKKPDDLERRAVELFGKHFSAKRNGLTYIVSMTFSSKDGAKAARIANGVADTYLKSILDAKYHAARRTGQWLQQQLAEMRKQATDADRAVQVFKSENHIVDTNRGLMSEQQLADLNSQLTVVTAAVAEAQAKLESARNIVNNPDNVSTVSEALNNPVIARLRAQYLDLSARAADLTPRYGAGHAAVVRIKNQMAQLQKSIRDECGRIASAYESDYEIALARQKSLQSSLNRLVSDETPTNLAQVKLRDLENSADSSRALLTGYLQKYQDASQLETFPISDARIITEAAAPLRPSDPKSLFVLAGAMLMGLILSTIGVVAREFFSGRFIWGEDIEAFAGLKFLGMLPKITDFGVRRTTASAEQRSSASDSQGKVATYNVRMDRYVVDAPLSRFAETIRSVKIAIDGVRSGGARSKVIGVISAAPGEGKTTVALNLAQSIAKSGSRTLIIDFDMRTCALSSRVGAIEGPGLLQAIADPTKLASCFLIDKETGLYILPSVQTGSSADSAGAISSHAMLNILGKLKQLFDYIILDVAPVVPVVDARAIAHLVDGFVFVVGWRATNRKMVQEAISFERIRSRIVGAVLNQVDRLALRELEAYRGSYADKYYIDDLHRGPRAVATSRVSALIRQCFPSNAIFGAIPRFRTVRQWATARSAAGTNALEAAKNKLSGAAGDLRRGKLPLQGRSGAQGVVSQPEHLAKWPSKGKITENEEPV